MKTLLLAITSILMLSACRTAKVNMKQNERQAAKITVANHQLPPSMTGADFTLIGIVTGKTKSTTRQTENFSVYTGKYILATKDELNKVYSDKNKYRYYIDVRGEPGPRTFVNGHWQSQWQYRYFICDRIENKFYQSRMPYTSSSHMQEFLLAIDRERKNGHDMGSSTSSVKK